MGLVDWWLLGSVPPNTPSKWLCMFEFETDKSGLLGVVLPADRVFRFIVITTNVREFYFRALALCVTNWRLAC